MTPTATTLVVLAKTPVPGRVKTRLCPPLSPAAAADVAAAALRDTLDTIAAMPAQRHLLSTDAEPGSWLPSGWLHHRQPPGGLDRRIVAALHAAGSAPAVLVGMDTPQLRAEWLEFDPHAFDACLGLAADGGYWAIGFRDPADAAASVDGVPMSTAHTGTEQLRRLRCADLRVQLLPTITDVDDIDSAWAVADAIPTSGFAAELQRVTAQAAS